MQRLWSFDDPRARWTRLVKNSERLLGRAKTQDLPSLRELKQLIDAYRWQPDRLPRTQEQGKQEQEREEQGGEEDHLVNRFVSLIFALADIGRFHSSVLNLSSIVALDQQAIEMLPLPWAALTEEIARARGLSADQKQYLCFCATVCPDWLRLSQPGPWSADSRAKFCRRFFRSIKNTTHGPDAQPALETRITYQRFSEIERWFHEQLKEERGNLPTSFLPEHVVIVEGTTEQILFPRFAELMELGWQGRAITVLAAGGAKQVLKRYTGLKTTVTLRLECVLDGDVGDQARQIASVLRPNDRLHILENPAIEETFARPQIVAFCNQYFLDSMHASIYPAVSIADLEGATNQECLERLWRKRSHASFDKIGFARTVAENLHDATEIPSAIRRLMNQIHSAEELHPRSNLNNVEEGS